jgi:hypothetical protein
MFYIILKIIAIISLKRANKFVIVKETWCVACEVGTEFLNFIYKKLVIQMFDW